MAEPHSLLRCLRASDAAHSHGFLPIPPILEARRRRAAHLARRSSGGGYEARQDLLAIDEALNQLAAVDKRKSQVVELRFFGGLSVKETADVLKVSPRTVMADWKLAKAWLLRELTRPVVSG